MTHFTLPTGPSSFLQSFPYLNPIQLGQEWLDNLEIQSPQIARWVCRVIPAQCPFEKEVKLFDRTLFRIPPLCKLNPFYYQLVRLRFHALCLLAETGSV